nr:cupin domain-containing protein [Paenibacillus senegalensis]
MWRGWRWPYEFGYVQRQQTDFGRQPYVLNIDEAARANSTYRTAIWTGEHLQVTLMSIPVGDDIGLEMHSDTDQFLRIEQGQGVVQMGKSPDQLEFVRHAGDNFAIMIPAGTWHNVINTGAVPLKLYSIYAPPHHPFGTVHETKAAAMEQEELAL